MIDNTYCQSSFRNLLPGSHQQVFAEKYMSKCRDSKTQVPNLAFLHRQDAVFNCISDNNTLDMDVSRLTQTMNPVIGLGLDCLGPAKVERNDIICTSKIETNTCDYRQLHSRELGIVCTPAFQRH